MSGAIHPADGLAAALMFIARNPEAAASIVVRAEPIGPAGESAENRPADFSKPLAPELEKFNCLDLIALVNGRRMTFATAESNPAIAPAAAQLIQRDPRRIRYELQLSLNATANNFTTRIGSRAAVQAGAGMLVTLTTTSPQWIIVRSFDTCGDTVCDELFGASTGGNVIVSVRETFLTPLPVDKLCD